MVAGTVVTLVEAVTPRQLQNEAMTALGCPINCLGVGEGVSRLTTVMVFWIRATPLLLTPEGTMITEVAEAAQVT